MEENQHQKQNIIAETRNSVLIACHHKSEFYGYSFWHPAKLVRDGYQLNTVSISYTEDFVFRLKKYGKGKYNRREIIDEVQLAHDEIEEVFKCISKKGDMLKTVKEEIQKCKGGIKEWVKTI